MSDVKQIVVNVPVQEQHKQQLEEAVVGGIPCEFTYCAPDGVTDEDLAQANVLVGAVDPARYQDGKNLEWVQLSWAGADALCKPGVLAENVALTNSAGAYRITCAEYMLAATFDLVRKFPLYYRNQFEGVWRQEGQIASVEGSTVAVFGVGDIGGDYARKMKALGAYVIGVRRTQVEKPEWLDEQCTLDDIEEILPRVDIVAMAMPGSEATTNVLDERRLRLMKPTAYLINIGRGTAIDYEALKKVLAEGHLAGVALDVFPVEPLPADDALWKMERVFVSPHIAGQLHLPATLDRIVDIAADNLKAWTHGEELTHVVRRDLGY